MQRHEPIPLLLEAEASAHLLGSRGGKLREQRVDHHVADETNPRLGYPLVPEVREPTRLGHEQEVRDRIRHDPVDLLRHRPVEAPETGLNVGHRHAELDRRECAGERAVHVAEDDRGGGAALDDPVLVPLQDSRGLCAVRPRSHFEVHVGCGDAQLAEEHVGQGLVVVLAGVDDADRNPPLRREAPAPPGPASRSSGERPL